MKKLLTACAVAGLSAAVFGQVVSANVVGYNTVATDGASPSPLVGMCFRGVGDGKQTFKDFAVQDGCWSTAFDNLQVINPDNLGADALLVYIDKTTADLVSIEQYGEPGKCDDMIGWWDVIDGFEPGEDWDYFYNDKEINRGFGFMGLFENYSELAFVPSGEVPMQTSSFTTDGESPSPIVVNYLPRDFKIKYFAPVDGCWSTAFDNLQVINPDNLGADALLVYIDKTTADLVSIEQYGEPGKCDDMIGWWDVIDGFEPGEDWDYFYNDNTVFAGYGFMGLFENYSPLTFQLPGAADKLD